MSVYFRNFTRSSCEGVCGADLAPGSGGRGDDVGAAGSSGPLVVDPSTEPVRASQEFSRAAFSLESAKSDVVEDLRGAEGGTTSGSASWEAADGVLALFDTVDCGDAARSAHNGTLSSLCEALWTDNHFAWLSRKATRSAPLTETRRLCVVMSRDDSCRGPGYSRLVLKIISRCSTSSTSSF